LNNCGCCFEDVDQSCCNTALCPNNRDAGIAAIVHIIE